MLGLLVPTPLQWASAAEQNLSSLLSDHAHCELKAATTSLSLVAKYGGEAPEIIAPLTALAHEETEHFSQVLEQLAAKGEALGAPQADSYVNSLRKAAAQDREGIPPLMDRLLVSALVEARSCERFSVLSKQLHSISLRSFYQQLMESEARHYTLFSGLSAERFGAERSRRRLKQLACREADIVQQLRLGPTVHG